MKYDLRHLKALVPDRTDGSVCPACFEVIIIFMSNISNVYIHIAYICTSSVLV